MFKIMCTGSFNFWIMPLGWLKLLISIHGTKTQKWAYSNEILYIHIKKHLAGQILKKKQ